jgi:hypothetical protein
MLRNLLYEQGAGSNIPSLQLRLKHHYKYCELGTYREFSKGKLLFSKVVYRQGYYLFCLDDRHLLMASTF